MDTVIHTELYSFHLFRISETLRSSDQYHELALLGFGDLKWMMFVFELADDRVSRLKMKKCRRFGIAHKIGYESSL